MRFQTKDNVMIAFFMFKNYPICGGTGMPTALDAVIGAPNDVLMGNRPAQSGRAMSPSSSDGSPERALAEILSKLSSTISVAADSFFVKGRPYSQRPGINFVVMVLKLQLKLNKMTK